MALIGAGVLWATQIAPHGNFWHDLAGPFFVAGMGTAFAFIPVSIGGLAGVTERDAGVASGLLNTSQQVGGAIGVAAASSIAASRFHTLVHHGYSASVALTGGFASALWVCGLTGLVAIPVAFVLIRRAEITKAAEDPARRKETSPSSLPLTSLAPWPNEQPGAGTNSAGAHLTRVGAGRASPQRIQSST
jgi:hypothetical protein